VPKLYIVPTPIGNLEDITLRAIRILKEVDFIISEDTRVTQKLLRHLGISKSLKSYHLNNEHKIVEKLSDEIALSNKVALVSDAGTPCISDPGFLLLRSCIEKNIEIECLPGPTAFVPALVESGLPNEKFVFEGFLPHKKGRQSRLLALALEKRTVVLYESPHRLLKLLGELSECMGADRQISVSREISKMFHESIRGSVADLLKHFTENEVRGEIVVCISASEKEEKIKKEYKK
jgi:16S rRNA (cytidine1402-2'-O)-methyltransferase